MIPHEKEMALSLGWPGVPRFMRPLIDLGLNTIHHRHERGANGRVVSLGTGGIR